MGSMRMRWLVRLSLRLLAVLVPAAAQAETHTYLNMADLYPDEGAGTFGPAGAIRRASSSPGSRGR